MRLALAVKSLPGRTWLTNRRPPDVKSATSSGITEVVTGNLTQDPIAPACRSQADRRSQFGLRQIRKGEWNQDDFAG